MRPLSRAGVPYAYGDVATQLVCSVMVAQDDSPVARLVCTTRMRAPERVDSDARIAAINPPDGILKRLWPMHYLQPLGFKQMPEMAQPFWPGVK